jgi:hypothetical protein
MTDPRYADADLVLPERLPVEAPGARAVAPETMPYLFMRNAPQACQHEYGGTLADGWVALRSYWTWYEYHAPDDTLWRLTMAGAHAFSIYTGKAFDPLVRPRFDCGWDGFGEYHVQAISTTARWASHLMIDARTWAPYYALMLVDPEIKRARLAGIATDEMIKAAPTHTLGDVTYRAIPLSDLVSTVHSDVCRFCGGLKPTSADKARNMGDAVQGIKQRSRSKKGG